MMLVSIEGQAIFHTADCSGPSMIERSNRRDRVGAVGGVGSAWASAGGCGARGMGGETTRPAGLELT